MGIGSFVCSLCGTEFVVQIFSLFSQNVALYYLVILGRGIFDEEIRKIFLRHIKFAYLRKMHV